MEKGAMKFSNSRFLFLYLAQSSILATLAAASLESVLEETSPHKRFSMNYLDLVDPNNPKSWQNTMPMPRSSNSRLNGDGDEDINLVAHKRFSMNFLDTIGASDPRSWQNTITSPNAQTVSAVHAARNRKKNQELQKKRNVTVGGQKSSVLHGGISGWRTLEVLEELLEEAYLAQGPEVVCKSPAARRVLKLRDALLKVTPNYESGLTTVYCANNDG